VRQYQRNIHSHTPYHYDYYPVSAFCSISYHNQIILPALSKAAINTRDIVSITLTNSRKHNAELWWYLLLPQNIQYYHRPFWQLFLHTCTNTLLMILAIHQHPACILSIPSLDLVSYKTCFFQIHKSKIKLLALTLKFSCNCFMTNIAFVVHFSPNHTACH